MICQVYLLKSHRHMIASHYYLLHTGINDLGTDWQKISHGETGL
jgi:hypothetical protein